LKNLGFDYITFDLEGFRSGSMLKTLEYSSL
jgi:PP-loop superfamily ATP-utilizing enzyme